MQLQAAREAAQSAVAYKELLLDSVRSLESGISELKAEVTTLREENAALRRGDTGPVASVVPSRVTPPSVTPEPFVAPPARVLRTTLRRTPAAALAAIPEAVTRSVLPSLDAATATGHQSATAD